MGHGHLALHRNGSCARSVSDTVRTAALFNGAQFSAHKGASIKYVRAEGEGGRHRNDQFLRTIVLIGCVKSVREGGGGPKSRKFCVRT